MTASDIALASRHAPPFRPRGGARRLLWELLTGADVLDLGCGSGDLLDHARPASYVGVDASAVELHRLRAKHPGTRTARADPGQPGWSWGLPTGAFDVIAALRADLLGDLGELLAEAVPLARPAAVLVTAVYPAREVARAEAVAQLDSPRRLGALLTWTVTPWPAE